MTVSTDDEILDIAIKIYIILPRPDTDLSWTEEVTELEIINDLTIFAASMHWPLSACMIHAMVTDLYNVSRDAFEIAWLRLSINQHLPCQPRLVLTASKDIKKPTKISALYIICIHAR